MHIPEYRDPAQIYLSPQEQRVFDKFRRTDEAVLTAEEYHLLVSQFLVEPCPAVDDRPDHLSVTISAQGRALRAYQEERRRAAFINGLKYVIATVIAIIGLVAALYPIVRDERTTRKQSEPPVPALTETVEQATISTVFPAASPEATPEPSPQQTQSEQSPAPGQTPPAEPE